MASFVTAADAVAAAVEIERRGHQFYTAAAERTQDIALKEFFDFMAKEEQRHEGIFSAMLTRLGGQPLPAGSTDEEYLNYVRGLLDSHTLFMEEDMGRLMKRPLHEAMRFEKDTLVFFQELQALVPDAEKHHVEDCAEEERKHMRMIAKKMMGI